MRRSIARTSRPLPLAVVTVLAAVTISNGCGGTGTTPPEDPTISFSLSPTSATIDQCGSVAVSAAATVGGSFTGSVTVTAVGAPLGITSAASNLQSTGSTTTVTVTLGVATTVAVGAYPITLRAAGSGISADATFTLTVSAAPAYTLSMSPDTITLEQSTGGTRDVTLARTNFAGDVELASENAPAGVAVSFAPNPVTADASTATVAVGGSVAVGTYDVVIRGTATGLADRVDTLSVTVIAPTGPAYLLAVTPDTLRINAGGGAVAAIDITRLNGHSDIVSLDLIAGLDSNDQPLAVVGTFVPTQATGTTSDLSVTTGVGVPPGEYTVTIRGQDGALTARMIPLVVVMSPAPAYTIAVAPDTLTVDQGASADVVVTLARTNFADAVALTVEGLPTGATASFNPASATGNTSTLTLSVGVAVADHTLTVRGTSSLPDVTETFVLTVVEPLGFSLSAVPDLTIQQGGSASQPVTIVRTGGFTGDVTMVVEGLTAGLTASVTPSPTSGNSATITVSATANVAVQAYNPTIRGTAAGQPDALTSMDINVTAAGGQQVVMDFSTCSVDDRPVWLAYQDGTGAWTPVTGVSEVYTFAISSGTGGVTFVTNPSSGSTVFTQYLTQAEFASGLFLQFCELSAGAQKTVNLTLANSVGLTNLSLGGALTSAFGDGPYAIANVDAGSLDFVGYSASAVGADRMVILRDQNIVDGGSLGTIDFTAGGFASASASITLGGVAGGETPFGGMSYGTVSAGNSCSIAQLTSPLGAMPGNTLLAGGAPGAQQDVDDFHVANLSAMATNGSRTVNEAFHTLADRTVQLGAALPVPTLADVSGAANYLRLQADFVLPAEYDNFTFFGYDDSSSLSGVLVFASSGARAGNVSLSPPDFSGLSGWTDSWAPAGSVTWSLAAFGQTGAEPACTEGGRRVTAIQFGSR